ncbi:MAG: DegT/DnrJ/EryC1/StrS family aminotransferase [Nitrospinae bacterium]|nr:DegT/DnrJ/EryC1/StrS family aminotransferase [Nitrospinota bacterium]
MPFIDLKSQYALIKDEVAAGIEKVLESGQYIMGPEIGALEKELSAFTGVKHAITCSSGTDALVMALMAKGIGAGDAVFTTPFTFVATAEAAALLGATPVFVDIEEETFNISPELLKKAVERTRIEGRLRPACVIPVDLFGLPADYDAIMEIAGESGLFVLEDAAQSFGGEYKGKKAGAMGHCAATSFFPAKPLGCYGDGGAIFTDDDELADRLRSIRVHGQGKDKYENVRVGLNGRLDTLQAAILSPKLRLLAGEIEKRQQVAQKYAKGLLGYAKTPEIPEGYVSAWAQYTIVTERREKLKEALGAAGVPTAVYYPIPLHLQKAFEGLGHKKGDYPASEWAADRVISLPMGPYLALEQQDYIITAVREALA